MSGRAGFTRVTTVTFDAGGTLLVPYPSVGVVYREAARRHGAAPDAGALDAAFRRAFTVVSKTSIHIDPEARERDYWRRIAHATFAGAGDVPGDFDACFHELWEAFARGEHWRVLPGVRETAATLRARGYRLAVLSNWDSRLHRVLAETGLRPLFDHVLISSELGAEKPDPAIFRAAERVLGVAPDACLHVGDSRAHDWAGALSAGWNALLVDTGDTGDALASLSDLLDHLPERSGADGIFHSSESAGGP
jgi:putative hydrolase of the HAD superfamily